MPRASRYYVPGRVWHLTHRCHGREFLLKFVRDRRAWVRWLFEVRKRFGLSVLNYMATSNHVHLLVHGGANRSVIPRALQLLESRTAQEYNRRKRRTSAFWDDRYHATAVQSGKHLSRCMMYITMNMVRAGVVRHPAEWESCGFHEIAQPPQRYARIDRELLARLVGLRRADDLADWQEEAVANALEREVQRREAKWTEAIGVGSNSYVEELRQDLGFTARFRTAKEDSPGTWSLREPRSAYETDSRGRTTRLSTENLLLWDSIA